MTALFSAFSPKHFSQNWLANPRADILSGLAVALALIPEAIAFSIIAGVSPQVGLYASFCIAIVVYSHNLALGVFFGVLLSALFFANKIGRYMKVLHLPTADETALAYGVTGQVFFCINR